jgi:hypothetical protein
MLGLSDTFPFGLQTSSVSIPVVGWVKISSLDLTMMGGGSQIEVGLHRPIIPYNSPVTPPPERIIVSVIRDSTTIHGFESMLGSERYIIAVVRRTKGSGEWPWHYIFWSQAGF